MSSTATNHMQHRIIVAEGPLDMRRNDTPLKALPLFRIHSRSDIRIRNRTG
jgi:hypothetical protein